MPANQRRGKRPRCQSLNRVRTSTHTHTPARAHAHTHTHTHTPQGGGGEARARRPIRAAGKEAADWRRMVPHPPTTVRPRKRERERERERESRPSLRSRRHLATLPSFHFLLDSIFFLLLAFNCFFFIIFFGGFALLAARVGHGAPYQLWP